MILIDTHCHLDFPAFDPDRDQVLRRCRAAGVHTIVVPGVTAATWPRLLALCRDHQNLLPGLGLHPMFADQHETVHLDQLDVMLENHILIAIGEIGLDDSAPARFHDTQRWYFEQQLQRAATAGIPVLLHTRKAHDQVIQCLRHTRAPGGIAHAFNGSAQQASAYLDLGFKLGFGGMLTYARSTRLRRLARDLPLEAIVLETDAPDMAVASHQYQRNSPEYLPEVLRSLAELRDEDPAVLAERTSDNARRVLGLNTTTHSQP